ncbi:hypothetical protein QRQ56_06865 [Bradyrhizobium sp. U531]|uniref:hypothetical protein n=1 Tax=Bradyrhizobium sp. U531 TaxID=3053458 RepID=UPI003F4374E9
MVAGSNPARGAKSYREINELWPRPHVARDLVALLCELHIDDRRRESPQADVCMGVVAPPGRRQIDSIEIEPWDCRIFTELIPMPDIQVDRSHMAPSILPADVPELSDDECLACLARAVETPDSARLDEVAALIGRLAVAIE